MASFSKFPIQLFDCLFIRFIGDRMSKGAMLLCLGKESGGLNSKRVILIFLNQQCDGVSCGL